MFYCEGCAAVMPPQEELTNWLYKVYTQIYLSALFVWALEVGAEAFTVKTRTWLVVIRPCSLCTIPLSLHYFTLLLLNCVWVFECMYVCLSSDQGMVKKKYKYEIEVPVFTGGSAYTWQLILFLLYYQNFKLHS